MKKIILIGATLLAVSTAVIIANNYSCSTASCEQCPEGVCKPGDKCSSAEECCKK